MFGEGRGLLSRARVYASGEAPIGQRLALSAPDGGPSGADTVWLEPNTPIYHGTARNIEGSLRAMPTEGWGQDGVGISFDRHPSVASGYADQRSGLANTGQSVYRMYPRERLRLISSQAFDRRVREIAGDGQRSDAERLAAAKQAQREFSEQGFVGVAHPTASMGRGTTTGEVRLWGDVDGNLPLTDAPTASPYLASGGL